MTATTTRPTITFDTDHGERVTAQCHGGNHRDTADYGRCDACGVDVAKLHGRPTFVETFRSVRTDARQYYCFGIRHVCDPERAAAYGAAKARELESGVIAKGQTVQVVKDRKVPKGTVGVVFWTGEDSYGNAKVGIRTEAGDKHFTAASNVEAVTV